MFADIGSVMLNMKVGQFGKLKLLYTSAVPLRFTATSTLPAPSGLPSPIVVVVCGSVQLRVTVSTSTSPPQLSVYSVPTASSSNSSFR